MNRRSIYVIEAEAAVVKIGISDDVMKRLGVLQSATAIKLRLMYRGLVTGDAVRLERMVHRRLSDRGISGEWFAVSTPEAIAMIEDAASELSFQLEEGAETRVRARADKLRKTRRNMDRDIAVRAVLKGQVTIAEAAKFVGMSIQGMYKAVGVKDIAARRARFAAQTLANMTTADRKPSKRELRSLAETAIAEFKH